LSSSSATVNNGAGSSATFSVSSANTYAGILVLSCPGLPANGVPCSFSGSGVSGTNLTLASGGNVTVTVTFQSTSGTGGTTANLTAINVTASTPSARMKSAGNYTLTLSGTNANADVSIVGNPQSPVNPVPAAGN